MGLKKNKKKMERLINKLVDQIKNLEEERDSKIFFIVDSFWEGKKLPDKLKYIVQEIDDDEVFTRIIADNHHRPVDLDIIVFSTGGTVRVSDYIISTLMRYPGNVRMHVPWYAHSAATMIVLSGKEIYLNEFAHLSPTDPHVAYKIGNSKLTYSHSLIKLKEKKKDKKIDDETFLAIQTAIRFHKDNLANLKLMLEPKGISGNDLESLLKLFGSGKYPHHKPYHTDVLNKHGLGIQNPVPKDLNRLFDQFMELRTEFTSHSS